MQYIEVFVAKQHIDSWWWLPWTQNLGEYIGQLVTSSILHIFDLFSLNFQ